MRKSIVGKILTAGAVLGGAAILISKLVKKNTSMNQKSDAFFDEDFDEDGFDPSSRTYVPISHTAKEEKEAPAEDASNMNMKAVSDTETASDTEEIELAEETEF